MTYPVYKTITKRETAEYPCGGTAETTSFHPTQWSAMNALQADVERTDCILSRVTNLVGREIYVEDGHTYD